jgi:LacI family transcriptional regulator
MSGIFWPASYPLALMNQRPLKRPTLHDVAKKAGVAVSTVSGILNNRSDSWCSQQTRERVLAAAQTLDYRPNLMARALRLSRFQAATLVVPDLTNPLFALLARSIQRAMEQSGYELLIEDTEESLDREKKILNEVGSHNTDGLIFVPSGDLSQIAARLHEISRTFPVVQFGPAMPDTRIDTVEADFSKSQREAIDHLVGLGHRSIGYVDSLVDSFDGIHRVAIFREQLRQAGMVVDEKNLIRCRHNAADVRVATARWASETRPGERATAFLCTNDLTALGSIRGFLDAGLTVPEDFSVVGFDDIPLASYFPHPLTTIAQPVAEVAAAASRTLIDRIVGKLQGPATHQVFYTSLVMRETTAPPVVPDARRA